jgi:hypothetical protein
MAQRNFYDQNVVFLYRQRRDDACGAVETSASTQRFSYPYGVMNFMATLEISVVEPEPEP